MNPRGEVVASGWKDALVADELEGVIDVVMSIEREPTVEMFHDDQANEEAILFASWA
jgi:ABC-type thiamine transport system substrate-binding protein